MKKAKTFTRISILTALGLVLFALESLFLPAIPFLPFAKIGISNVVVLLAIMLMGNKNAFLVMVLKCTISALFIGNPFAIVYSLSGGVMSFAVMAVLYQFAYKKLSIAGISMIGSVVHNIMQVLIFSLLIGNVFSFYILSYLVIFGAFAGLLTGVIAQYVVKRLPDELVVY